MEEKYSYYELIWLSMCEAMGDDKGDDNFICIYLGEGHVS